ncbi:probable protein phosphatase 2C 55 [Prunus avium]|uniref:Protein phosphatase n=1 Tax=Prunus avium TaxID=42229 RepID=A0A6P5S237_PRUAV|nr:probable protein phosphatase 2C 55 [Prunus avium]
MIIAANKPPTFGLGTPIDDCYGSCGYGYGCGPVPDQKRKLNNPIDQVQELKETNKRRKIQNQKMKLVCGSCYCPKDNPEKPLGEDAHFISHFAQTIGLADGVGGWARKGIDAGEYARGIMNHAKETATHMAAVGATPVDARKVLNEAYENNADVQGSSTACILSFDKERGSLHAVNVGDSGLDSRLLVAEDISLVADLYKIID